MFVLLLATAITIAPAAPLDERQSEGIRLAEERGQRLFRHHRIAPYAAGLGKREVGNRFSEVAGYVSIEENEAQVLTFIGSANAKEYAVWRARFLDGKKVTGGLVPRSSERAKLSRTEAATRASQRAALQYFFSPKSKIEPISCAGDINPNYVALPPTKSDPNYLVYVLTPQTDKDVFTMGGYYRMTLDADRQVTAFRALGDGCHDVDLIHDGSRLQATYVKHEPDIYPTEIHVLASLVAEAQIMVTTVDGQMWVVEKGRIAKDKSRKPGVTSRDR